MATGRDDWTDLRNYLHLSFKTDEAGLWDIHALLTTCIEAAQQFTFAVVLHGSNIESLSDFSRKAVLEDCWRAGKTVAALLGEFDQKLGRILADESPLTILPRLRGLQTSLAWIGSLPPTDLRDPAINKSVSEAMYAVTTMEWLRRVTIIAAQAKRDLQRSPDLAKNSEVLPSDADMMDILAYVMVNLDASAKQPSVQGEVNDTITLKEFAESIFLEKKTLQNYGKLPEPALKGKGNQPHQYRYRELVTWATDRGIEAAKSLPIRRSPPNSESV